MNILTVSDFRRAMRNGPFAWPGGYPLFFVTRDGAAISYQGARYNRRAILEAIAGKDDWRNGWQVFRVGINWEDPELYCDVTGERIPSAYAEDQAPSTYR